MMQKLDEVDRVGVDPGIRDFRHITLLFLCHIARHIVTSYLGD